MSKALVEVHGVSKSFQTGDHKVRVLDGVHLSVAPQESVAIVGPSGSGKSTLLNLLGTLDQPDQGTIVIDGKNLSMMGGDELARFRNRNIGFVFQSHHLLPHLTVLENVLVPALAQASEVGDEVLLRANQLLQRVGLGDREKHLPGRLSGGERQRVAVVRALINQPRLILADEPTGALDRVSAAEVGRLLIELNREHGITLIVATHSEELAARMDRVLTMENGTLV
ncbi:MAG: ABC transporter ATP-binding protein [Verrucomicrobia bacterium]|jgi:ABC-type lipoprotein export system ATPase subunit|nr:ABC transporter ATP-binding protein [Verrucomicrobiota bacterium]